MISYPARAQPLLFIMVGNDGMLTSTFLMPPFLPPWNPIRELSVLVKL